VLVTRLGDYTNTAQAGFVTRDGDALAGIDYVATAGTITFAPFESAKILSVQLIDDSLPELYEDFFIALTNAVPPTVLAGTNETFISIEDDDHGFRFSSIGYVSSEPAGSATITVWRGSTGSNTVSVDFAVSSGTATAGLDFIATNGTLVFLPGETQKTFSVTILADQLTEGTETVLLTLTNASANTGLDNLRNATLGIFDVDGVFKWSGIYPGGESAGYTTVTVLRNGINQMSATVDYIFSDGTAINGTDYFGTNGTLYFAPGESIKYIVIPVANDGLVEGSETFTIRLTNPTGGETIDVNSNFVVTILDNDAGMSFVETNVLVSENSPFVTLTVLRHDDGTGPLNVEYFTADGTALAGVNYVARSGTLNFPTNSTTNFVTIPLIDQCALTNDRAFTVSLRNPSAGGALGSNSVVAVTIRGNDQLGGRDVSLLRLNSISVYTMKVLPSGQILAAAPVNYYPSYNYFANTVLRLNSNGLVDNTFGAALIQGSSPIFALEVQHDGRILAGGSFLELSRADPWLERMTSSGQLDATFNQPTNFYGSSNNVGFAIDVSSVVEQPDGRILVARDAQPLIGPYYTTTFPYSEPLPPRHPGIMRLLSNGSSDPSFTPGSGAQYLDYRAGVQAIALQPDGRILIGGLFTNFSGYPRLGLARLNTNGVIEPSFVPDGGTRQLNVSQIELQKDGKILIVGAFSNLFGTTISGLARLFTNGLIDTSFNPMPITGGTIQKILLQPNGRIVIGGNFTNVQGYARYGLARLNADASLDTTFDPSPDQYNVIALALQPDGRILVSDANTGLWRVEGDPIPRFRDVRRQNDGGLHLILNSRPGKTYTVETSTNLIDWQPYQTRIASDCALDFLDLASPPGAHFFRAFQVVP